MVRTIEYPRGIIQIGQHLFDSQSQDMAGALLDEPLNGDLSLLDIAIYPLKASTSFREIRYPFLA